MTDFDTILNMGIYSQLNEAITYIEALKNLGISKDKILIKSEEDFRANINFWAYGKEFNIPLGEIRHLDLFLEKLRDLTMGLENLQQAGMEQTSIISPDLLRQKTIVIRDALSQVNLPSVGESLLN